MSRSPSLLTSVASLTCGQAHAFDRPNQGAQRRVAWVVALTVVMMVVEILAGWRFHSMALLADGWHMSTHAIALGISLLAYHLAARFAGDHRFAFGTWKIEILGAYTSALLLAAIALSMLWESAHRLFNPGTIQYGESMLVAAIGLAVNLLSAWLLGEAGHSHGHQHDDDAHTHGHHDLNKRAAYIHVLTDAATSVLALVALLGGMFWGAAWLDPLMGLVGGVVILIWAKGLLVETSRILIDADSEGDANSEGTVAGKIRELTAAQRLQLEDLHVWRIGAKRYAAIVGIHGGSEAEIAQLREKLEGIAPLAHLTMEHH